MPDSSEPPLWTALAAFLMVASVLYLVMGLVVPRLPLSLGRHIAPPFAGHRLLRGWAQWDSAWYYRIAQDGYSYVVGQQSTVAFFPVYPLVVRVVAAVVGNVYVAGVLVTLVAGAGAAVLLLAWLRARMPAPAAWWALLAFLLFPYAFYLYGVVYADALFLVAVLGAFLLLEADRPVLAGVVGTLATACRPVGVAVIVALTVRALERSGALRPESGGVVDWGRVRLRDGGVLLSALGLAGYCFYLWSRFGDPFAFATVQEAWHQGAGPATWFKVQFFRDVVHFHTLRAWLVFMAHPVVTIAAACLIPRVFRRFGAGYGVYVLLLVGLSALSTRNFFGMARYLLAAFPCFAVVGEALADRVVARRMALSTSAIGLVVLTALFGTGYYLS